MGIGATIRNGKRDGVRGRDKRPRGRRILWRETGGRRRECNDRLRWIRGRGVTRRESVRWVHVDRKKLKYNF